MPPKVRSDIFLTIETSPSGNERFHILCGDCTGSLLTNRRMSKFKSYSIPSTHKVCRRCLSASPEALKFLSECTIQYTAYPMGGNTHDEESPETK